MSGGGRLRLAASSVRQLLGTQGLLSPAAGRVPRVLPASSASCQRPLCGSPSPPGPSPSLSLPVPTRCAAGTGSRSLFLPWSPALCAGCPQPVPSGTSVSTTLHLGLLLGCKDPKVSEVRESPLVGVGPRRRSPSLRLVLGYPSPEDHRGWPEELWTGTRAGGQEKVAKESENKCVRKRATAASGALQGTHRLGTHRHGAVLFLGVNRKVRVR